MQDTLLTYETKKTYNKKALATLATVGAVCGALAIYATMGSTEVPAQESFLSVQEEQFSHPTLFFQENFGEIISTGTRVKLPWVTHHSN